jgi:hypothetical protein
LALPRSSGTLFADVPLAAGPKANIASPLVWSTVAAHVDPPPLEAFTQVTEA